MNEILIWLGILFCLSQSAVFSGANLAVFSLSRLRLEAAAAAGDTNAQRVLKLRQDANFTLVTILVGNVAINVLLTLLADSVLAGVAAFLFSTVVITALGEIAPQAYLSRHALQSVSFLSPVLNFYRFLLWPVAKPGALLLDAWVGREAIPWLGEREIGDVLRHHAESPESEVSRVEAIGAINFLALDDIPLGNKGERLDPASIVSLPVENGIPVFPSISRDPRDGFLQRIEASGMKWIVITDEENEPRCVVDAHRFLRDALFSSDHFDPNSYCVRPLIARNPRETVGDVLAQLTVRPESRERRSEGAQIVLLWAAERRIITGSDILECLMEGIAQEVRPIRNSSASSP